MSRTNIHGGDPDHKQNSNLDEFPALGHTVPGNEGRVRRGGNGNGHGERPIYDPGRTRFSSAVKKQVQSHPPQLPKDPALLAARREAMGASAEPLHHDTSIVAPKPSPRLKLRPPALLPTLPTGESVNRLYMAYRSRFVSHLF